MAEDMSHSVTEASPVPKGGCFLPGNPVFSCVKDVAIVHPPKQPADDYFQGYNHNPVNPMYKTTAQDYGDRSPTIYSMPNVFHGKSQKFSNHLGTCGMYKNQSLNTAKDIEKF